MTLERPGFYTVSRAGRMLEFAAARSLVVFGSLAIALRSKALVLKVTRLWQFHRRL